MAAYTTADIRNIALVGNPGAGKTTLVEAMLFKTGAIPAMGNVTKGNTVCDFDPQEKEHQHTLNGALVGVDFQGKHINLIDTPGYPDLLGRAMSILPAVETAVVVLDPRGGLSVSARRLMEAAGNRGICRAIIINKIDVPETDLIELLGQVAETFGSECLPVNLPADGGKRVVDCFLKPGEGPTDFSSVEEARTRIVDQVVEIDEKLMEMYLEQGEDLDPEQLHDAFEQALREGHLIPVCFTSAEAGAGIDELLEVFARLMPNPLEGNPPPFLMGAGADARPITVVPDPDKHAVAHVFKVSIDSFVGRMGVFRIHQGTITKDSQLLIGDARKPFKVGHLYRLQGKDTIEVPRGIPGDICAVTKVEEIHMDAVLHDSHEEDQMHLKSVECPAAMYGLAVQPKNRGDEQKISDALHKLAAEDPCFLIQHNPSTNETVVRGLGDLHLRIMLEKMKSRYNVEVETRPPRIAYQETVTIPAEGHYRHKKQTGGAGQFGEVYLRIEPLARGVGFEFEDAVVGGVIPNQFIPAIEKGVRQVLSTGAIGGYPVVDLKVTVYDGKHHSVDSKEVAFVTAGKKAFLDAISKARPIVLEPIVNIQVTVPQDNMGDIAGDLSSKRGRISGTSSLPGGMLTVSGQVPMSELDGYQSYLKSVTGGAGSYTIDFSHYEAVPPPVQQKLAAEFRPKAEED